MIPDLTVQGLKPVVMLPEDHVCQLMAQCIPDGEVSPETLQHTASQLKYVIFGWRFLQSILLQHAQHS